MGFILIICFDLTYGYVFFEQLMDTGHHGRHGLTVQKVAGEWRSTKECVFLHRTEVEHALRCQETQP